MSELVKGTAKVSGLGRVGSQDAVDETRETLTHNEEVIRTAELPSNSSVCGENGDTINRFETVDIAPLDTRWRGDQSTGFNCKDPSWNGQTHESTSSEEEEDDEQEGGAFAANWYVPLPQDPQQSDEEGNEEGDSGQWSEGASGLLQPNEEDEEASEGAGRSDSASDFDVKPSSKMEDSQVEAIKKAMAGFSLPPGSQPQWAHVVPEDVWKAELIGGLQQKHRHKSKAKATRKKS